MALQRRSPLNRHALVSVLALGYIAADQQGMPSQPRRGGRVVECTALEMRHTGNRIGGSNPSLSAILFQI